MVDGTAYISLNYLSLSKPFELVGRSSHCGGTDKWTMARLNQSDAEILAEAGVPWHLNKEPNWVVFHNKMALLEAEADVRKAQKRLDELISSQKGD